MRITCISLYFDIHNGYKKYLADKQKPAQVMRVRHPYINRFLGSTQKEARESLYETLTRARVQTIITDIGSTLI